MAQQAETYNIPAPRTRCAVCDKEPDELVFVSWDFGSWRIRVKCHGEQTEVRARAVGGFMSPVDGKVPVFAGNAVWPFNDSGR